MKNSDIGREGGPDGIFALRPPFFVSQIRCFECSLMVREPERRNRREGQTIQGASSMWKRSRICWPAIHLVKWGFESDRQPKAFESCPMATERKRPECETDWLRLPLSCYWRWPVAAPRPTAGKRIFFDTRVPTSVTTAPSETLWSGSRHGIEDGRRTVRDCPALRAGGRNGPR